MVIAMPSASRPGNLVAGLGLGVAGRRRVPEHVLQHAAARTLVARRTQRGQDAKDANAGDQNQDRARPDVGAEPARVRRVFETRRHQVERAGQHEHDGVRRDDAQPLTHAKPCASDGSQFDAADRPRARGHFGAGIAARSLRASSSHFSMYAGTLPAATKLLSSAYCSLR